MLNSNIKFRESFRPFAPAGLVEDAPVHFELAVESPYMLLVAHVREALRLDSEPVDPERDDDFVRRIGEVRSVLPAVTHVDYSARVQTVHPEDDPFFHRLLVAFRDLTGFGVLVNTSFNVRGQPIVCSPRDAFDCFCRTGMDLLVLEDCLVWSKPAPEAEVRDPSPRVARNACLVVRRRMRRLLRRVFESTRPDVEGIYTSGPEPDLESYFLRRRVAAEREEMEIPGLQADGDLAECLCRMWRREGRDERLGLAREIADLASRLELPENPAGEVPTTIYAMF